MPIHRRDRTDRLFSLTTAIFGIAVCWSLFQLYFASSVPFFFNFGELNDDQQRPVHLAFALVLAFLSLANRSQSGTIAKGFNVLFAFVSAISCFYLLAFYQEIIAHAGGPHSLPEIATSVAGLICLLEGARRFCGIGLAGTGALFIAYAFAGPYLPDVIAHGGTSLNRLVDHLWLTTEGVFGITLAVSNDLIFLFVLFGALLEKAGAGRYFIRLALSLVGHLRGGPAKACVVSSALFGMISGSSLANLMTVGTFTIPLMKKVGFTPEKAAAIETCSSINGQLMPPVMGAAAFIMAQYVGIPYFQVIKHAFLPAVIAYITLYYIVHVESEKLNRATFIRSVSLSYWKRLKRFVGFLLVVAFALALIAGLDRMLSVLPDRVPIYISVFLLMGLYVWLLRLARRYKVDEVDDELDISRTAVLPETLPTLFSGLYYFIPVGILIWCLMISRLSPRLAVEWGIFATSIIVITQPFAIESAQRNASFWLRARKSFGDLIDAFATGGLNMISVAIALGAAGIVVGVVSQTGLGLAITGLIESAAGTNLMVMLGMTAIICVVLGMGLPTTANYIVVVALMVAPITTLAQRNGVIIPAIAIHLFVFYFGLLAGTTPPVAVDAFAGAAVANSNPMKTAIQAFIYDLRTSSLPFIFVFNTELLMIGITNVFEFVMVVSTGILGMIAFAAVIQNYFFIRNRIWEAVILLLASFVMLRPGYFIDLAVTPFYSVDFAQLGLIAGGVPADTELRLYLKGTNISGDSVERVLLVPLITKGMDGADRVRRSFGLTLNGEKGRTIVDRVDPMTLAQKIGVQPGWEVTKIEVHSIQPNKHWLYLPAILLLALVAASQLRRRRAVKVREEVASNNWSDG